MVNKKTIGLALMAGGITVLVMALAADMVGLGVEAGFGYKQIAGSITGVVLAVAGIISEIKNRSVLLYLIVGFLFDYHFSPESGEITANLHRKFHVVFGGDVHAKILSIYPML